MSISYLFIRRTNVKRIVQINQYDFDEAIHKLEVALELLQTLYRKGEKVKSAEEYLKYALDRLTKGEN
jgi:hypothetical protein